MKRAIAVLMTVVSMGVSGCGGRQKYRSDYVNFNTYLLASKKKGKVLILTDKNIDQKIHNNAKLLFWNYQANLSQYVKNIALKFFKEAFAGGAEHAYNMPQNTNEYQFIIRPKIEHVDDSRIEGLMGYSSTVTIFLEVDIYNSESKHLLKKIYTSGKLIGKLTLAGPGHVKETNRLMHKAIIKNMEQILIDINKFLDKEDK